MKKIALFLLLSCFYSHIFSATRIKSLLSTGWQLTKISSIFAAGYYVKSQDTENVLGNNTAKIAVPIINHIKGFDTSFTSAWVNILRKDTQRGLSSLPESTDIENPTSTLHIPTAHIASSLEYIKTSKQENNSRITTITEENSLPLSDSKEDILNNPNN